LRTGELGNYPVDSGEKQEKHKGRLKVKQNNMGKGEEPKSGGKYAGKIRQWQEKAGAEPCPSNR